MKTKGLAVIGVLAMLAGCSEPAETPAAATPVTPTPPAVETPAVEPASPPLAATDAAGRMGALQLSCGGESFRVAFEDTRAVLVNADGGNTELVLFPADANAAPGVSTYTDGKLTFAKSGGGDTPTLIRFARGRMAFQDCAIAVN